MVSNVPFQMVIYGFNYSLLSRYDPGSFPGNARPTQPLNGRTVRICTILQKMFQAQIRICKFYTEILILYISRYTYSPGLCVSRYTYLPELYIPGYTSSPGLCISGYT